MHSLPSCPLRIRRSILARFVHISKVHAGFATLSLILFASYTAEVEDLRESDLPAPAPPPRILALDVGRKRIGLAVTDPLGLTVQPLFTLHRGTSHADVKSIGRVVRKHAVAEIVVGNPLHMSGEVSPQALKTQAFAEDLRVALRLPVHLSDERLTTSEAHRHLHAMGKPRQEHRAVVDQVAAVLILEGFLAERAYAIARARRDPPAAL